MYFPLNTGCRDKEVEYFISDAKPVIFVCTKERSSALEEIAKTNCVAPLESLDGDVGSLATKADEAETTFEDVHRSGDDLAAILYTSGTTGRSKGAMLSHNNLCSNALVVVDYWKFSNQDIMLHALPIYQTHGLFVASNTTLLSGAAPLSPQTHKEFTKRTVHTILERYGMTETNMNTSNSYEGKRKAGTVGLPLPGVEIRITDQITGETVKSGDVGMIEIRGPNVFESY